jgi:seryl-tRNA synthetase
MERPLIDYSLLADAVAYYAHLGYRQVEVPWIVGSAACFATLPVGKSDCVMRVEDQYLVGSAEQGFLEIELTPGRYLAVSPCFRRDTVDELHQQTFMKVELHQTDNISNEALHGMIEKARAFFRRCVGPLDIQLVGTPEGWDIEVEGVEVGSYGRRTHGDRTWLYGTALALPRLSIVRQR